MRGDGFGAISFNQTPTQEHPTRTNNPHTPNNQTTKQPNNKSNTTNQTTASKIEEFLAEPTAPRHDTTGRPGVHFKDVR